MKFTLFRHATSILNLNGLRILIDPVFAPKASYPPIRYSYNSNKNPLHDLPVDYKELLNVDGVIITHNHNDHFDERAKEVLPKDMPILCQKEDYNTFCDLGFTSLTAVDRSTTWLGIKIQRFKGYHGGHLLKRKLGVSSSYLLSVDSKEVYLTGDTLLTFSHKRLLKKLKPQVIIAYGGGARIKFLGKLTMNNKDILELLRISPMSKTVVVHMHAINHCAETTQDLVEQSKKYSHQLTVPRPMETIEL